MVIAPFLELSAQYQTVVPASRAWNRNDTIRYYLPEGGADSARYPAVILLHGYGGNYKQWSNVAKLQVLSNEYGMALICPDGFSDSWYIDSPSGSGNQYSTFFGESILPAITGNIPVDTSLMFITGLSMGGHGAIHLLMQYPEVFCAAGSLSGVMDLRVSALAKTSLARLLGPKGSGNPNWAKYSAIDNIEKLKQAATPIIICCGSQDYLIEANRAFARKCTDMGIDFVYMESPGKHERDYWRRTLPEQLRFFRKYVNKKTLY